MSTRRRKPPSTLGTDLCAWMDLKEEQDQDAISPQPTPIKDRVVRAIRTRKLETKIKQQFDLAKINNNIKDLKDVVTSWIICLLEFSDDDFNLWCNVPELYFY